MDLGHPRVHSCSPLFHTTSSGQIKCSLLSFHGRCYIGDTYAHTNVSICVNTHLFGGSSAKSRNMAALSPFASKTDPGVLFSIHHPIILLVYFTEFNSLCIEQPAHMNSISSLWSCSSIAASASFPRWTVSLFIMTTSQVTCCDTGIWFQTMIPPVLEIFCAFSASRVAINASG